MPTITHPHIPLFSSLDLKQKQHAKHWLWVGLLSIALSGLAPLLLLAGRASVMAEMQAIKQWFVPVLVIHVNLSVGLWFLALTIMLWRILWPIKCSEIWHRATLWSFLTGVIALVCSPLAGGEAYTSNYIPVQDNALFFFGLSLVFTALMLTIAIYFKEIFTAACHEISHQFVALNMLVLFTAMLCFALSIAQHPEGFSGEGYYEAIYWAGGHILQFVYVQIAIMAWCWMAPHCGLKLPPPIWLKSGFLILSLAAFVSPLIYWFVDINSYYHIKFFSWQMNLFTGTIPGLLALYLFVQLFKNTSQRDAIFWVLAASLILFLSGGLVGFLIEGSNTIIPAHYHGSTVGVTLAMMGVAYLMLTSIGGINVLQWKMAKIQPILYGAGQLLHVVGFAIAGTQGVGRKVAGKMDGATELAQAGMQLVRFGGLLAVIGGGLFVVIMIKARKPKA